MENFSVKKLVGEVIGTLALVLVGAGTALLGGGALEVALAFGLTYLVLIAVARGHYNPAVSLAAAIDKRITWVEFAIKTVAQVVGAMLAALLLWVVTGASTNLGANSFVPLVVMHGGDQTKAAIIAVLVETIMTFLFVLTVLRATDETEDGTKKHLAPVVIGFALTALIGVSYGLTGGSLNPARSIAPALIQGGVVLEMVWVFIVGPFVGAVLAALVHKVLK